MRTLCNHLVIASLESSAMNLLFFSREMLQCTAMSANTNGTSFINIKLNLAESLPKIYQAAYDTLSPTK